MIEDVDPASLKTPGAVGAGASPQFQFSRMAGLAPTSSQETRKRKGVIRMDCPGWIGPRAKTEPRPCPFIEVHLNQIHDIYIYVIYELES